MHLTNLPSSEAAWNVLHTPIIATVISDSGACHSPEKFAALMSYAISRLLRNVVTLMQQCWIGGGGQPVAFLQVVAFCDVLHKAKYERPAERQYHRCLIMLFRP